MLLPHDSIIAIEKMTEYVLRWRPEDDKSRFLEQAGYTAKSVGELVRDIRDQLLTLEADFFEETEYGPKYLIRGALIGPNGRTLRVVSIWMAEEATGETKFVTLYPDKR